MRKMKFLTLAAAMFAVSSMMSSCSSSDDNPTPASITITPAAIGYAVYATSNEAATFSVDVSASTISDAKSAAFYGIASSNKTVKVTAKLANGDGFISDTQTAVVNFSDKNTAAAVVFNFVKKSTDSKSQEEVANSTDPIIVKGNLLDAVMIIPGGTTVAGGDPNEPFSITVFEKEPFIITAADVVLGQPVGSKIYTLKLTPSKGTLSAPVTIRLNVGKSMAGQKVSLEKDGVKVTGVVQEDGTVEFEISDLSGEWALQFDAVLSKAEAGSSFLLTRKDVKVVTGSNTYSFDMFVGCKYDVTGVLATIINTAFGGPESKQTVTRGFYSSGDGTIDIDVYQNYVDYTITYLNKTYVFRVWGNDFTKFTPKNGNPAIEGHSAGLGH